MEILVKRVIKVYKVILESRVKMETLDYKVFKEILV
jgi:hypothetical protein